MQRALNLIEVVAGVLLLGIAVLIGVNVASRNFLSVSVPDWYDGSRLLLACAMAWGIAVATYRDAHIRVDLLWDKLGARNRHRLSLFAAVVTALSMIPLAWMMGVKTLSAGTQNTSDLQVPVTWFYGLASAGFLIAAILASVRVWQMASGRLPRDEATGGVAHGS